MTVLLSHVFTIIIGDKSPFVNGNFGVCTMSVDPAFLRKFQLFVLVGYVLCTIIQFVT